MCPIFLICAAIFFAPCLVLEKTRVLPTCFCKIVSKSAIFDGCLRKNISCVTLSVIDPEGATSMLIGNFIYIFAICKILGGIVAEKSITCFSFGTFCRIFLISGSNPISSIRSASSSTRIETLERDRVFLCI